MPWEDEGEAGCLLYAVSQIAWMGIKFDQKKMF